MFPTYKNSMSSTLSNREGFQCYQDGLYKV